MDTARKQSEKDFHDKLRDACFGQRWSRDLEGKVATDPLWVNMKYYSIERKSRRLVLDWFARNCKGKTVLDYCCGNGDDSMILGNDVAEKVVGIDISETSINNCRERAIKEGLGKKVSFQVMDAENMTFGDSQFDIITEYGCLHHLDIRKAYPELARVLKPDGKCLCVEALGHNLLINFYRRRTPLLRTNWEVEHILKKADIESARMSFEQVDILGFFHMGTLLAVPFRNSNCFNTILAILEKVDALMLKLPILKWQAWQVVFMLSKPRKR